MIASPRSSPAARARSRAAATRRHAAAALAVAGALAAAGCASPPVAAPLRMLEPIARTPARPPEPADHAAARVAAAALAGHGTQAARALEQLEHALDVASRAPSPGVRARPDGPDAPHVAGERTQTTSPSAARGDVHTLAAAPDRAALLPLAIDLASAARDDPRHHRETARALLARPDLNPAHRARLEQEVADDPLELARARSLDSWESLWAQSFNAVSRPLGRSLLTGLVTAPYEIAMSAAHYLAALYERPVIDTYERQALVHRERFLARHPDAPQAPRVRARAARARRKLTRLQRDHFVAMAELALEHQQPRLAAMQAERALVIAPADGAALRVRDRARAAAAQQRALRRASLDADAAASAVPRAHAERELLRALLVAPPQQLLEAARRAAPAAGGDPARRDAAGEIAFVEALAQYELGGESASWARLEALAHEDPRRSSMARHAAALVASPWQNPHRAFERERMRGRQRAAAQEVLGGFAGGPRYRALPAEVAYLIDAPLVAQTALSTPFRLLLRPLQPASAARDSRRGAAIAAYRYLERHPRGEHFREHVAWLFDYERERGNAIAALRLADLIPGFDPQERQTLAERAADQQLAHAAEARRRDLRSMLLRGVVREFPDSQAGHAAGLAARRESEQATPQRIRLTRGFLIENPRVAGPGALGLDGALLDGDPRNGELHPRGVTFLGGRVLELALLARSGDEDDEPETRRVAVSSERLARTIAWLDESAVLGMHLDSDDVQEADGLRDYYFERARLGLTGQPDLRPTAESSYVYRGLRERYGLVRGRDSVLPFDLVFQGSLRDLSLGAFPRWRMPEPTPDAFLYR